MEEEDEQERNMSRAAPDLEAANVKNLADMAKFFQEQIAVLPTTEYMDNRLSKIEKRAEETVEDLRKLERRVTDMERLRPRVTSEWTGSEQRLESVQAPGSASGGIALGREEAFLRAIRTIRIWPIDGNNLPAKVDDFFKGAFPDSTRRGNKWKRGHNDDFKLH